MNRQRQNQLARLSLKEFYRDSSDEDSSDEDENSPTIEDLLAIKNLDLFIETVFRFRAGAAPWACDFCRSNEAPSEFDWPGYGHTKSVMYCQGCNVKLDLVTKIQDYFRKHYVVA